MSIYDINDRLIKTLADMKVIHTISKRFNLSRENYDKVNFVEKLLIEFHEINKIKLKFPLRQSKNNELSLKFRKDGNEYFSLKNRDLFKAVEMYNKSVCYSEENSENIAIGYANRSAVFFEWKRYKECLENIQMARNADYPQRLMHKLNNREKSCKELLHLQKEEDEEINPYEFEIKFDRHPKVPFIADCLDVRYTKDEGRFIYTKCELYPGDLVSIEAPFCSALLPHMRYIRCGNCNRENNLILIPCPNCTSAMFCSETCRTEAMESFHKYECPVIDFLYSLFNKIHLTALRVCLAALNIFSTIDECIAFCRDPVNQNKSCFDLDYNNLTKKEHYRAIHGLITNQEKRSAGDLFQRGVVASVLKHFLIEFTPLKQFLSNEDGYNFFAELLFKHLQTSPSNMHSIDLIEQKNESNEDHTFATAAYAFHSLVNHSCAPNTVRIFKGTTTYLFILRPITANGVLYDNYGYHYSSQNRKDRQEHLRLQYQFVCTCEACENDYPPFLQLLNSNVLSEGIQKLDVDSLMAYDRNFALKNFSRYCEYLTKHASYYPHTQISSTEESLKMALYILVDAVPLKAKVHQFIT